MLSNDVSPESSSRTKTSTPANADRNDSLARLSSFETLNSGLDRLSAEEQPPNFCIRDYVFGSRRTNLSTNWPFSHKFLQHCLSNGLRDILPPFKPSETLESSHPQLSSSPPNAPKSPNSTAEKSSHRIINREKKKSTVFNVCPVCLSFTSPSNTTLNAHIDQCLLPEIIHIKQRGKPKKMKSMVEICATAPEWTLEDLDRRNGSNWAKEVTFAEKVNGGDGKRARDGPIYVDSRGTKVLILSKLNGSFENSSKDNAQRKKTDLVKRSTETIPDIGPRRGSGSSGLANGFAFQWEKVSRRKRSRTLTSRYPTTTGLAPLPKTRSISLLTKTLTLTGCSESSLIAPREIVCGSTGKMDESQIPTEEEVIDIQEAVDDHHIPEREDPGEEIVDPSSKNSTKEAPVSSPLSSTSTISQLAAEERESTSSSTSLERENPVLKKNHQFHASEKLKKAQPRRFFRPNQFLPHHQFKRHRSPATNPILRLMGKNLTLTNNPRQILSHPMTVGFPYSNQREDRSLYGRLPMAGTGDHYYNYYREDLQRVESSLAPASMFPPQRWVEESSSYYWPPRWGGSHNGYHGAPMMGDSRVSASLPHQNLRLPPGISWVPRY